MTHPGPICDEPLLRDPQGERGNALNRRPPCAKMRTDLPDEP